MTEAPESINRATEASDFWDFSFTVYTRTGVAELCLMMQDHYGFDINLILLMLWLEKQQLSPTQEGWAELLEVSSHWQKTLLAPAREERQKAKGSEFYEQLKAQELELEKKEQQALLGCLCNKLICQTDALPSPLNYYITELEAPADFEAQLKCML